MLVQVDELVKKHLIEEALLLAETKFALDAPRDKNRALQVMCLLMYCMYLCNSCTCE